MQTREWIELEYATEYMDLEFLEETNTMGKLRHANRIERYDTSSGNKKYYKPPLKQQGV